MFRQTSMLLLQQIQFRLSGAHNIKHKKYSLVQNMKYSLTLIAVFLLVSSAVARDTNEDRPQKIKPKHLRGAKKGRNLQANGAGVTSVCVGSACRTIAPVAQPANVAASSSGGGGKKPNGKKKPNANNSGGSGGTIGGTTPQAQEANVGPTWDCAPGQIALFRPAFKGEEAFWTCMTPPGNTASSRAGTPMDITQGEVAPFATSSFGSNGDNSFGSNGDNSFATATAPRTEAAGDLFDGN